MTPNPDHGRPGAPTIAEVAALTRRLRALSDAGRGADPGERAAFLADKHALIARITDTADTNAAARDRSRAGFAVAPAAPEALTAAVLTRTGTDGYVLVGPSARTWRRDPDTGRPTMPVPDAEHQAVRDLLGRYALDTAEPEWVTGPDGRDNIHTIVRVPDTTDDLDREQDDDMPAPDQLPAYVGITHPADTTPAVDARLEMPGWMREQAAAAAVMAAGTAPAARRDHPDELAARIAALHEQLAADAAAGTGPRADRHHRLIDTEQQQEERREQLTRWHTDDTTHDGHDRADDGQYDAAGRQDLAVLDDGPGLL